MSSKSIYCKICNKEHRSFQSLSKHIKFSHRITSEEYTSLIFSRPKCPICLTNDVAWASIASGYKNTCNDRSCSASYFRKSLKLDEEKFNQFRKNLSEVVKKEWKTKDQTKRIAAARSTNKKINSLLTPEERRARFGWLNKLHGVQRDNAIKGMTKNMLQWHSNLTPEEADEFYTRRARAILNSPVTPNTNPKYRFITKESFNEMSDKIGDLLNLDTFHIDCDIDTW